jgi:enoyl-CoA hydratase
MTSTFETLSYAEADDIATITLDRPKSLNALSFKMMDEIYAVLRLIRSKGSARVVLLTGSGEKAFCVGADIKERAGRSPSTTATFSDLRDTLELFRTIEEFDTPVIAAINGYAMGGGLELALCADIRIAARHAMLGLPELKLGALPAAGGTQRLARLIGVGRTKELLFTGEALSAETAHAMGLVNHVVEGPNLLDFSTQMAKKISKMAPLAVRFAKRAVHMGSQVGLEAGLEYERYAASILMDTADRKEGMQAFVEKRDPRFTGN